MSLNLFKVGELGCNLSDRALDTKGVFEYLSKATVRPIAPLRDEAQKVTIHNVTEKIQHALLLTVCARPKVYPRSASSA